MLKGILILIVVTAAFILTFNYYPDLDLEFSRLFYNNDQGFFLKDKLWVYLIHKSALAICFVFLVGGLLVAFKILIKKHSVHPKYYKKLIYICLVCIIGPGLLVHIALKDNFGRPRPHQVMSFGGGIEFQYVLMPSKLCLKDCSFPSGHASVGFMIFGLAFLFNGNKRLLLNLLAIFLGGTIGLARIMEGDHFLSDIIFSGIIVYLTAYILNLLIKPISTNYNITKY